MTGNTLVTFNDINTSPPHCQNVFIVNQNNENEKGGFKNSEKESKNKENA